MRDLVDELLHAQVRARLFGGDHAPRLGRLVLRRRLGAGAMGTVFAAHDPRLDREVAVKVVTAGDRVLTEARMLARLAHPNVVAIHDADEVDGVVYLVMELVAGASLRAWVAQPRPWRDVVRVMRQAGAGVAAAHARGIVHRDLKPDNILIGDDRARVGDFGLAGDDAAAAGTPAYMAPELLAGGTATALSDQYAFGVTLHEALHGARPDAPERQPLRQGGPSDQGVGDPCFAGDRRSIDRPRVPMWLDAVIARARAAEPAARFPSMDALVAALSRDRRRGRAIAIAGVAIAAGAALGAVVYRARSSDACTGGPDRRAAVWNDAARTRARAALGSAAWAVPTLAAIDERGAQWEVSYRRVCEATRTLGEQSDTLLDLRMRCLGRSLDQLGALIGALDDLDAGARLAAPSAVANLPPPEWCETLSDEGELALPADPAARGRAEAAQRGLDRAWAAFALGRYEDARDRLAAIALPDVARLHATALALSSSIETRIGDPERARRQLDEALVAAAGAHAPELELDLWSRRLRNELFSGDPAKIAEWESFARAAARRAGRDGAELDGIAGEAQRIAGHLAQARALLERGLASPDPLLPAQRAVIEMNLGSVELAAGDEAAALATLHRARDRVVAAFGDRHPDLAIYDDKLAATERARGHIRDALTLHDRSGELRAAAFGPDDRSLATTLHQRALTELEAGELGHAYRDLQAAFAIREKVYGAGSPRLGELYAALGDAVGATPDGAAPLWAHERGGNALVLYEHAGALDPRLDLVSRRIATGAAFTLDQIPPLAADELPSVDRISALATRVDLLARAGQADEARALATRLRAHFHDGAPALAAAIGRALAAAGDRAAATEILAAAAAKLANDPSRSALAVWVALARADEDRAAAAARAAISLYQAMPELARDATYDEMLRVTRL